MAIFDVNCCLQLLAAAAPIWSIASLLELSLPLMMLLLIMLLLYESAATAAAAAGDVDDIVNESMLDTFA